MRLWVTKLFAVFAATFFVTAGIAVAQTASISFSPAAPTSTEVIRVSVDTGVICQPVFPKDGVLVQRTGQDISIVVSLSKCLFGTPPPPYAFAVDIGPLEVGTHQVTVSWQRSDDGINYIPRGVLISVPLAVTLGVDHAIPTLDWAGKLVLMTLVLWLGFISLRHRSRA